jgi:hypothetical protein
MADVRNSEVLVLLGRTEDEDLDVTPFIRTATLLVTTHLSTAGLTAEVLHELTLYLAAWLVGTRDPRFSQVSTDGQSFTVQLQSYWDIIRLLDTTGRLEQALTTKRISIKVF